MRGEGAGGGCAPSRALFCVLSALKYSESDLEEIVDAWQRV